MKRENCVYIIQDWEKDGEIVDVYRSYKAAKKRLKELLKDVGDPMLFYNNDHIAYRSYPGLFYSIEVSEVKED